MIHAYLTRGQFTTAEFKALLPEEGLLSRRVPLLISAIAAAAIGATVWLAWPRERAVAGESPLERVLREKGLDAAEEAVRTLGPEEQQRGFYALAKASFYDRKDPGNALLLSNKALNLGFHPAIAALRAEILIDQGTVNLADAELKRMEPSLQRMSPETRAQYHWLTAQVQLRRMETGDKAARRKAREALRQFIAMKPEGRDAALEQAKRQLQSLE